MLRAEIDRGGFQQGDDINVSVLVTNETSRDVACTEVSLVQRTLFVGIEGKTDWSLNNIISVNTCDSSSKGAKDLQFKKMKDSFHSIEA